MKPPSYTVDQIEQILYQTIADDDYKSLTMVGRVILDELDQYKITDQKILAGMIKRTKDLICCA